MILIPRRHFGHKLILFAMACTLMAAGCRRETPTDDHEEDHTGHVIPAHKPRTLPDAVQRLRELNAEIGLKFSRGNAQALNDDRTLPIALDIAYWLPEIAADSDMPEQHWNIINRRSELIVSEYQKVASSSEADSTSAIQHVDQAITDLERLIADHDPRWFDTAPHRPATP